LLNPDAYAAPQWLERLCGAARRNRDFAFFGSRMLMDADPAATDPPTGSGAPPACAALGNNGTPVKSHAKRLLELRQIFLRFPIITTPPSSKTYIYGGFHYRTRSSPREVRSITCYATTTDSECI